MSLLLATIAKDAADGTTAKLEEVDWDRAAFPYLTAVSWGDAPLMVVQSRDQKVMRLINAATGELLREDADPDWTDVIDGVPAQLANGDIVWTGISDDTRGLIVAPAAGLQDAKPLTPPGLEVLGVLGTDGNDVLFAGATEPTEIGVWRYGPAGLAELATEPGVNSATAGGGAIVLARRDLASNDLSVTVRKHGAGGGQPHRIASLAPGPEPAPPAAEVPAGGPVRHPHGGAVPVLAPGRDQAAGADGPLRGPAPPEGDEVHRRLPRLPVAGRAGVRGCRGRRPGHRRPGPAWDRAVAGDLATGPLEDQIAALQAAAEAFADLDTERVAIRGWSFGGYLSALALLRRPDVFHAAIVGAPVTDFRLYDTHYTERYLGDPTRDAAPYEKTSIINDPERTGASAARPMLIIHGLADDNVFVAHSLRLSSALLAAGYPHSVLPLSGVTHMAQQEVVAENMLTLQVDFLKQALGFPPASA